MGKGQADVAAAIESSIAIPGIELRAVSCQYSSYQALDRVELTVHRHRRLGVIGPSGCGKSTLLNLIAGLREPDQGEIKVLGQTAAQQRLAGCALMPQRDLLLPWRTALDNAVLALENRGWARKSAYERVQPLFERLGLEGFQEHRPHQLSGGMRQRVAFLRTLVADKEVLLLDEPFGALDHLTRGEMQEWLRGVLQMEPRTVVLVTHDVEEALLLCDEVAVLSPRPGRVAAQISIGLLAAVSRRERLADPCFARLRDQVLDALGMP